MFNQVIPLKLMYSREIDAFAIGIMVEHLNNFVPLYVFKDIRNIEDIIADISTQLRIIILHQELLEVEQKEKTKIPDVWENAFREE